MQVNPLVNQQGTLGAAAAESASSIIPRDWLSGSRGKAGQADAARLLIQASFGPTEASIASVMSFGINGWLESQFALPQTLHRAYIEQAIAAGDPAAPQSAYRDFVMDTFWKQAITAEDQLRQRMAFALSQIFVVSQVNGDVGSRPRGLASYLDMLGANAFGNFRTLLEAVTLHPIMGLYLSHLRNQKENPATGRVPDENFAREVMQLFTIGLYELNTDGSQKLDSRGRPIPTYDNADVEGLAKVFTGWSWAGPDKSNTRFFGGTPDADRDILPMQAYPQYHSTSPKSFLDLSIPANTPAEASLKTALDGLFNHPNTGPFIARQLIQRFVTSNPSPGYVPPNTAIAAAGLVAPEFQITGENSTAGYLNFMRNVVNNGAGSGADVRSSYAKEVALAGNPDQLVDRVKLLLTANQMTDGTRLAIRDAVASIPATAANSALNRAKLAVYLALASSEFVVQK
jgi:uncharacterized protein (DUF1800 family)